MRYTVLSYSSVKFAKIVGSDWEYYMTKPNIILGRRGTGVICDVHKVKSLS